MRFESLPVDLIADILGELDIKSLVTASMVSKRLRDVVSDPSFNPWRRPILRLLCLISRPKNGKNASNGVFFPDGVDGKRMERGKGLI
ncbi:hypothetical protein C0992_004607 [Termitomyces sp. T32_za158]|nr:hypothetical protein C0992_004607 [Termitomyces sp. T32_za158]